MSLVTLQVCRDTKIPKSCDVQCPFLETLHHRKAMCLLFKESLVPSLNYSEVEYWSTCQNCDHVCQRAFNVEDYP